MGGCGRVSTGLGACWERRGQSAGVHLILQKLEYVGVTSCSVTLNGVLSSLCLMIRLLGKAYENVSGAEWLQDRPPSVSTAERGEGVSSLGERKSSSVVLYVQIVI